MSHCYIVATLSRSVRGQGGSWYEWCFGSSVYEEFNKTPRVFSTLESAEEYVKKRKGKYKIVKCGILDKGGTRTSGIEPKKRCRSGAKFASPNSYLAFSANALKSFKEGKL